MSAIRLPFGFVFPFLSHLIEEIWCIFQVVVNSVCCAAATFGWVLRWFVFGRLRAQETQQLRDRFWNFVFHKFVFVFGVLNATYVDEVVLWTFWFMSVGLVYLLTSLAQDRFKYVSILSLSNTTNCFM